MSKHLKDDELPVEDTEGQLRIALRKATDTADDDTEGHVRTYPAVTGEDDTEGHLRIALRKAADTADDDTEGHALKRLEVTDAAESDDDTEGHRLTPRLVEPDLTDDIVSRRL